MNRILTILRRKAFWLVDSFKGGQLRKQYEQVSRAFWHLGEQEPYDRTNAQLKLLLERTVADVPFYRGQNEASLKNFPIVNKSIIKESINEFISRRYEKNKLYRTTTSGSTGTPFTVFMNAEKVRRHQAENIFFSEIAGYRFGEALFYLRVWNDVNSKGWLERFSQNVVPVEISNLSSSTIDDILTKIARRKDRVSILGFGSALESIAAYIQSSEKWNSLKMRHVRGVAVMSEHISQEARSTLGKLFGCEVLSRYSNMENGFIAQQTSDNGYYRINTASFIVEILSIDANAPVKDGELGRIVVTDLFNFSMPLIRYDTGDLGIKVVKKEGSHYVEHLAGIEGRRVDAVFNTSGEVVSPHAVTNTMWKYSDVRQFQFIQQSRATYEMRLNTLDGKVNEDELRKEIQKYFGADADIRIIYVDEIPVLSSGKRKKIINNYSKNQQP